MEDPVGRLIELALAEDIGSGDVTAAYFVPPERRARAFAVARRDGVVSGITVAARVFSNIDPALEVEVLVPDGSQVAAGAMLMRIEGAARSVLTGERTALNELLARDIASQSDVQAQIKKAEDALAGGTSSVSQG